MDSGSMASALQHKGMKTGHSVPCLLLIMGPGAAPEMQRGWRGTPGSDWRSSSAGKATRWSWGQGHSVLLLLPAPGKWQLGFWSLCILLFMICPSCTSRQVFVVPCSLFVFCSWGDVCPGVSSDGKASAYSAGDPGSIPGSGRSPGEGNGNPLQYSCLENPMDRGAW